MGLTIGCAKRHSHKFDPITQKEYYRFFAIFNQTADNDQPDESPDASLAPPIGPAKSPRSTVESPPCASGSPPSTKPVKRRPCTRQIARLARSKPAVPSVPVMRELAHPIAGAERTS